MAELSDSDIQNVSSINPTSKFHIRNAIIICIVLAGMGTAFLSLMIVQHQKSIELSITSERSHFDERVTYLDSLLKQVTNHLKSMQGVAQTDLLDSSLNKNVPLPQVFQLIKNDTPSYFHMDNLNSVFTDKTIGNLTGNQSIIDRDTDFYREIRMALLLNPLFESGRESIQTAAWFYYISTNEFINLFPWVKSKDYRFTTESFNKEFYTLALPENNPNRQIIWTQVYVDEAGMGLMTTIAIPTYDKDRFMGVIAIDLTVDFLNAIVNDFRPDQGRMFLVNDRNQLLAHPDLTASKDSSIKKMDDAIPEQVKQFVD